MICNIPLLTSLQIQSRQGTDQDDVFRFEGASLRTTRPSVAYAEVKMLPEGWKSTTTTPTTKSTTTLPTSEAFKPPLPTPTTISKRGGEWLWKNQPTKPFYLAAKMWPKFGQTFTKMWPQFWQYLTRMWPKFGHDCGEDIGLCWQSAKRRRLKKKYGRSHKKHSKVSFTQIWALEKWNVLLTERCLEDSNVIVKISSDGKDRLCVSGVRVSARAILICARARLESVCDIRASDMSE